ncbi:MFS transporter [Pseudomonas laurylsulfatiphila]|uniref:MFS transporter n=2 Tax=Pseudomonas laurylsulfatiphila TaxID=2011015 RepID=A0A2S6FNB2_9PSED|nr:MFS transporter [Pseudomonas laurylsulfatiphila]
MNSSVGRFNKVRIQKTGSVLDIDAEATSFPGQVIGTRTSRSQREGWAIVLGLAVVLCIIFGTTLNSISVFTLPITSAFQCSNEQASRVATAFMFTMTLAMPLAGWLLDRVSPRPVMTVGALIAALGYLLASQSADIDQLTFAIAVSGIGVGTSTYVPAITIATRWIAFDRQGLAFGILLAGSSTGAVIFPMLLTDIIAVIGWRNTMQVVAGIIGLLCIPILLWAARTPESQSIANHQLATQLEGHGICQAMRMPRYWLWIAMQLLLLLSSIGVFIALVPYLVSTGYSAEHAAAFLAGTAVAALIGNFAFGMLSDRWGAKAILLIGTVFGVAGIFFLLAASDPVLGVGAITLFSLIWGSTFNLVNQFAPLLLVEAVGQRNFGSLLGIGNLIAGMGSAFSPTAVGYLVDVTHTYTVALLLCAALAVAALIPIALQRSTSS